MKKYLMVLVSLPWFFLCLAQEPRNLLQRSATTQSVGVVLLADRSWVPYPSYQDREAWDRLTAHIRDQIVANGERYIDYQWRVIKATDYLAFERTGSRSDMEEPFNENSQALCALFLAELAEGKGRFMDQLINGVWYFSELTSWALSAHLPGPQRSHRVLPDHSGHVIDLAAGDIGSLLSWIYHFFRESFDKVDPSISTRLRKTVKERIVDTYMERDDFWWQAFDRQPETLVNNWNPWCNFNVLTCFLILEDDPDRLAAGVYRTMRSVDEFLNYVNEDGACEEGPSYWGHAAGKLYDYLQLLSYATKGQISIFEEPIIRHMGEYISRSYVGNGWVVNFADASAKGGGDMSLIYRYGTAVGSIEMQQFAAYLFHQAELRTQLVVGRDAFRTLESLQSYRGLVDTEPALPTAASTWYPETEFCYLKNGEGLFLAAKGGHNNESHNHNDIGSFSLYVGSTPFFIDVGVGTYTRKTFSSERYSIWTMQSNYHNLPRINGVDQAAGATYRATDVSFNEVRQQFSLDIAKAYPREAQVQRWVRRYRLSGTTVYLEDDFVLEAAKKPNQVHFLSWAKPDTSTPGAIRLWRNGHEIILYYAARTFEVTVEPIKITDSRLSSVWGTQIYQIVLKEKQLGKKGRYRFRIDASIETN